MAQKILILGNSGTGKSASMRNFKSDEVMVISCAGKPLPFKNDFEIIKPKFESIVHDVIQAMDKCKKKVIVIDDFQYLLSFPWLRRIKEKGWEKFEDIQSDYFNIIQACDYMPDDVSVYFMSHTTTDENGNEKIKTIGKMLDERIQIEGMFTICLKTIVSDGKYYFLTQNSGRDTVKSPIGMFDSYAIDNDLKYVDEKIRNYYQIGDFASDEEMKEADEKAAAPEVEKPDSDGRKRRKKKKDADDTDGGDDGKEIKEEKKQESVTEEKDETPKRRKRKVRTTTTDESENGSDNGTDDTTDSENGSDEVDTVSTDSTETVEEKKPKRRRRKKQEAISDDELPF